jgi:hypothetical protein
MPPSFLDLLQVMPQMIQVVLDQKAQRDGLVRRFGTAPPVGLRNAANRVRRVMIV